MIAHANVALYFVVFPELNLTDLNPLHVRYGNHVGICYADIELPCPVKQNGLLASCEILASFPEMEA